MSLLTTIASAALVLLSQGIPASADAVAANNNAPTTSIVTGWCPEDYNSNGNYETHASVIAVGVVVLGAPACYD